MSFGQTVLVCEDDEELRGLLGRGLREEGFAVEAVATGAAALACAALLGWLLAEMLIAMLQHVFDPPPDRLAVPWTYLGGLAAAAVAGGAIAVALASRGLARLRLGEILREE